MGRNFYKSITFDFILVLTCDPTIEGQAHQDCTYYPDCHIQMVTWDLDCAPILVPRTVFEWFFECIRALVVAILSRFPSNLAQTSFSAIAWMSPLAK